MLQKSNFFKYSLLKVGGYRKQGSDALSSFGKSGSKLLSHYFESENMLSQLYMHRNRKNCAANYALTSCLFIWSNLNEAVNEMISDSWSHFGNSLWNWPHKNVIHYDGILHLSPYSQLCSSNDSFNSVISAYWNFHNSQRALGGGEWAELTQGSTVHCVQHCLSEWDKIFALYCIKCSCSHRCLPLITVLSPSGAF